MLDFDAGERWKEKVGISSDVAAMAGLGGTAALPRLTDEGMSLGFNVCMAGLSLPCDAASIHCLSTTICYIRNLNDLRCSKGETMGEEESLRGVKKLSDESCRLTAHNSTMNRSTSAMHTRPGKRTLADKLLVRGSFIRLQRTSAERRTVSTCELLVDG